MNGAEKSLLTLMQGINESGRLQAVLLAPEKGPLVVHARSMGIKTYIVPYVFWTGKRGRWVVKRLVRLVVNLVTLPAVLLTLKRIDPDLVYTNSLVVPSGALAARILKIPHIWHAREFVEEDFDGLYDWGASMSMSIIERFSKAVICNSSAVRQKLYRLRKWRTPLSVTYNGFDVAHYNRVDATLKYKKSVTLSEFPVLLMVGSVMPQKGHEQAVLALKMLIQRGLKVTLKIAGNSLAGYPEYLESILSEYDGMGRHVLNFEGVVEDIDRLYQQAAITLVCSKCEAFGRVAVESLLNGTPVIGTNNGGIPEVIQDDFTGLLYEPGNYTGLADKIELLLNRPKVYERILNAGQADIFNRFGKENYIKEISGHIGACLYNTRPSHHGRCRR